MAATLEAEKPVDVVSWLVALFVANAAGTTLLWISRPAANANLPFVSSRRAILEIALGVTAALWASWHAPLILVTSAVIARAVMAISYNRWGGIYPAGVHVVRAASLIATLLIATLPESSLYFFAR